MQSLGFTAAGAYFYGTLHWVNNLYLATLDREAWALHSLEKVTTLVSVASSAGWSPDGRSRRTLSGL